MELEKIQIETDITGERRSGKDRRWWQRRQFNYTAHIPERRDSRDRRNGFDRRRSFSLTLLSH